MTAKQSYVLKPKAGYVFTKTIIQDIKKFRIKTFGENPREADKSARTCITDFVKHVASTSNQNMAIIQSQTPGRRQLAINILGPWLFSRAKLKGFTSPNCPYVPPITVELKSPLGAVGQIGQVLVNAPQTIKACQEELRAATKKIIDLQKELEKIKGQLKKLEDADLARRAINRKNASSRRFK